MVSRKVIVDSPLGIHLRPAGAMSEAAIKYEATVMFKYGQGKQANAKSVISILASGVKCGEEIEITAEGVDEEQAIEAVAKAFQEALNSD